MCQYLTQRAQTKLTTSMLGKPYYKGNYELFTVAKLASMIHHSPFSLSIEIFLVHMSSMQTVMIGKNTYN
uniref:Uncharacterized protein n=1 Tax=Rhizophora mucronata TaxID=61149 RepID=A0A2P2M497_RHIMU